MSVSPPRIALLGLHLESNAFAPPTREADFRALCWLEGEAMLAEAARPAPAMPAEMVAVIRAAAARGWIPVPILVAAAEPGGPVEEAALDAMLGRIASGLAAAGRVDGVYVSNHGAMTATATRDADGRLYRLVRAQVGTAVPIVATLDLHANPSAAMVETADCLIAYRTNPHVDQAARGAEAAERLAELLGGARFETAWRRLPLAPPTVTLLTAAGPYAELIAAAEAGAADPAIAAASVAGGFVFADAPDCGLAVLAYGRRPGAAAALADTLARRAWAMRERFWVALTPLDAAVAAARRAADDPAEPPLLLADVADNPGGGGRGDTTAILDALLAAGVQGALLGNLVMPELAAAAHRAGSGARLDTGLAAPAAEAVVRALADGRCVGTRGIWAGRALDIGPCAALDFGGVTAVVATRRKQCADPVFFTLLGLDPAAARVLVVKSRGHFRAGFDRLVPADRILEVDAPGLTSPVLERYGFRHLPRPVWPLDPDASWTG